jgi:hypothetical protein
MVHAYRTSLAWVLRAIAAIVFVLGAINTAASIAMVTRSEYSIVVQQEPGIPPAAEVILMSALPYAVGFVLVLSVAEILSLLLQMTGNNPR